MMTLRQAKKHAEAMTRLHGVRWLVFKTPASAAINQYPLNLYNKGRYAACAESERADYEAGGAEFIA